MMAWRERWRGIAFLVGALLLWEGASRLSGAKAALFPPPSVVLGTLATMLAEGRVLLPLGVTMYRLAVGFSIALTLAVTLGVTMGYSRAVYNLLEPLVEMMRPIPKAALVAPLIFFLGLGDTMKITVIALGTFFPMLVNVVQGVRGLEPEYIDTARTFGTGTPATLRKIVFPAVLPHLFAGMHISLGVGLLLVIIAEMISADGGLGYAIANAQRSFRVREMYAWVLILALTGYALNIILAVMRARLLGWNRTYEASQEINVV
jgi:ABC-type nitrate/sulfonate/bicarbonate transport system permease component